MIWPIAKEVNSPCGKSGRSSRVTALCLGAPIASATAFKAATPSSCGWDRVMISQSSGVTQLGLPG